MNLREAAQQALEALVDARVRPAHKQDFGKYEAAITALRAALAEPEQKPLTDEQILKICQSFRLGYTDQDLARAIERAHGIGDSNE